MQWEGVWGCRHTRGRGRRCSRPARVAGPGTRSGHGTEARVAGTGDGGETGGGAGTRDRWLAMSHPRAPLPPSAWRHHSYSRPMLGTHAHKYEWCRKADGDGGVRGKACCCSCTHVHPPDGGVVGEGDAHDTGRLHGQDGDGVLARALLQARYVTATVKRSKIKATIEQRSARHRRAAETVEQTLQQRTVSARHQRCGTLATRATDLCECNGVAVEEVLIERRLDHGLAAGLARQALNARDRPCLWPCNGHSCNREQHERGRKCECEQINMPPSPTNWDSQESPNAIRLSSTRRSWSQSRRGNEQSVPGAASTAHSAMHACSTQLRAARTADVRPSAHR